MVVNRKCVEQSEFMTARHKINLTIC